MEQTTTQVGSPLARILAARLCKAGETIGNWRGDNMNKPPEKSFFVKVLDTLLMSAHYKFKPFHQFMSQWEAITTTIGFHTDWYGQYGLFDGLTLGRTKPELKAGEIARSTDTHGRKIIVAMTEVGPVIAWQFYSAEDRHEVYAQAAPAVAQLLEMDTAGQLDAATYEFLFAIDKPVTVRVTEALAAKAAVQDAAKEEKKEEEAKTAEAAAGAGDATTDTAPPAGEATTDVGGETGPTAEAPTLDAGAEAVESVHNAGETQMGDNIASNEVMAALFRAHWADIETEVPYAVNWGNEASFVAPLVNGEAFMEPTGEKPVKTLAGGDTGIAVILLQTVRGVIAIGRDNQGDVFYSMSETLAKMLSFPTPEGKATPEQITQLLGDIKNPNRSTAIGVVKLMTEFGGK